MDKEVSFIFKDQTESESNDSQIMNDSSSTFSYTFEDSNNESADQGGQVTLLEQDQQTTLEEDNDSSNDSPIPPTRQFSFSEPTDQDQIMLTGNSKSLNLSPKSRTQFSFAAPATQDQYSPVSEVISPLQSQSLFSQTQIPVNGILMTDLMVYYTMFMLMMVILP